MLFTVVIVPGPKGSLDLGQREKKVGETSEIVWGTGLSCGGLDRRERMHALRGRIVDLVRTCGWG